MKLATTKELCNNYLGGRGVGKWAKYGSKLSRTPLLTRQKLTLAPPHLLIILRSTPTPPPPPASCPIGSLITREAHQLTTSMIHWCMAFSKLKELIMKLFDCLHLQQTRLAACLRDLLNSRSFVGEAENVIKEFLSDWPYPGLLWLIHKLTCWITKLFLCTVIQFIVIKFNSWVFHSLWL